MTVRLLTYLSSSPCVGLSLAVAQLILVATTLAQEVSATGDMVTQNNYARAESDRTFYNIAGLAGGVNRFWFIRNVTPLDKQTVVRMNKDTLYAGAVVDTSKGATIAVPEIPDGRYFSVLMIDNDHYTPGVIYSSGTYDLPRETKYLFLILRIQLLHPDDPKDVQIVNDLQDRFIIKSNNADPFPKPKWDPKSLAELTNSYNAEFGKYEMYPDGFMGPRGIADDKIRHLAAAGAWGLFPNKDAVYINYNPHLAANKCYRANYAVPENKGFWSITVYGDDGYMKSANGVLNRSNVAMKNDGTFDVSFGSPQACGDVPNRLDISEGWNFLMRVYRPGRSVLEGKYKLPKVTIANPI